MTFRAEPAPPQPRPATPNSGLPLDQIARLYAEFADLEARHGTTRLTRAELKHLYALKRQLLQQMPVLVAALQEALTALADVDSQEVGVHRRSC